MRLGTIEVREALPANANNVTDTQIQEALWHYYYDIGKSVSYLVNTYAPRSPKAPKKSGGGKATGTSLSFEAGNLLRQWGFVHPYGRKVGFSPSLQRIFRGYISANSKIKNLDVRRCKPVPSLSPPPNFSRTCHGLMYPKNVKLFSYLPRILEVDC
jgi:hypothetical protein